MAKYIFAYNLRKSCWRNVFGKITKATMAHRLTPKKAHIDGSIFFQNPYCWFILEHFWQAWLNQQPFPEILSIFYFNALWACQACLTTPNKKFMIKLQLPWISYSTDILLLLCKLSNSNSFWDIKIKRIMQSDWSRVFSTTTQELDFSQPCGFYRF